MKHTISILFLILFVLNSYHCCILADDVITEEYILNILNGNDMGSSSVYSKKDKTQLNNFNGISCNIKFNENSIEIGKDSYDTLVAIGKCLESNALNKFNFMIIGYPDPQGTKENDVSLPLQRAENVKEFFTTNFSIGKERLIVKVKEESSPTDINDTESEKREYGKIDIIRMETK